MFLLISFFQQIQESSPAVAAHTNTGGLICDIVGVILAFSGDSFFTGMKIIRGVNRTVHNKWKDRLRFIGLSLMIFGFLCQIASNYMKHSL